MFNSLAVAVSDRILIQEGQRLAESLSLPFIHLDTPLKYHSKYSYILLQTFDGVFIAKTGKGAPNPVSVDFTKGAVNHRRRFGGGKGQDIAKAVGLNKKANLSVLDATAGLGRDAFVLACLGCTVSLCERVGFVRALLKDGLHRAALHSDIADIIARMSMMDSNIEGLSQATCYDVVYLDPMYPHTEKSSAAVKKEMSFFRDLVGKDEDADCLLSHARALAKYRIVVKRPKGAEYLNNEKPTYQLDGKSGRFDVYVLSSLDPSTDVLQN